jgi:hypothetical protein
LGNLRSILSGIINLAIIESMRCFALRLLVILLTLSAVLSSCALPSWIEQINNQKPVSYIGLIKPQLANQGDAISFTGHGIDADGEVVAWIWRSDIDGELSKEPSFKCSILSVGQHIIYFKVQDNSDVWSVETQQTVKILGANSDLPEIGDFSAYPTDVAAGDSTTIYWNVAGATSVNIDPGIGSVSLNGSRTVIPVATTVFKLTASNPAGTVSETCRVNVTGGNTASSLYPVINYFYAADMVILPGDISSISWSVSSATSVTIEPSIGLVAPEGYLEVCPSQSIEYTLTATNDTGSVTKSAAIGVALKKQFMVTQVRSSGSIVSGANKCPSTLDFTFTITANGAGIVTYYIRSSTGVTGPTESLEFREAGTLTINTHLIVSAPGVYWETLNIITPEKRSVDSQPVTGICSKVYGVTDAFCITGPLSGRQLCPFTLFYTFSITANGPCIVTYYIAKSDGTATPYQSITFGEAGSRTVDISWTVYGSGIYWVELVVTSPDKVTAISEAMDLTCE